MLIVVGGIFAIVVLGIIVGNSNSGGSQQSADATSTSPAAGAPQFQETSVGDLASGTLVQVQGTLIQKGEFTYNDSAAATGSTSYFLKIKEGGAVVLVMPKDDVLSNFNIGDVLLIQGAVGTLGDCANPDPTIEKLCQEFKLTAANTLVIIPTQSQPSNDGIVVAKAASGTSASNGVSQSSYAVEAPSSAASENNTSPSVSQYADNPSAYLNSSVVITGEEKTFLPSTGTGSGNYVEITDLDDPAPPLLVASVGSLDSYTAVVNGLQGQYYPIIRIYGTGAASQAFTETNSGGTVVVPVVSVTRLDVCTGGGNNSVSLACSTWTTLFQ